jgi:SAM-dependent methyltransferase
MLSPLRGSGPSSWIARKVRKAADIVFYAGLRGTARILGFKPRHRARDRRLLDEEILPRLAANDRLARILFVGCDWYTEHVEQMFVSRGRAYTTIEIDPARARHGGRRHIVGALADLGRHSPPGSFDLIVCNGVIGWGLNDPAQIERSMEACVQALAQGGVLLLGWDDVPEKLPIPIEAIEALRSLRPAAPEGFEAAPIRTDTYSNHTFAFFAKP